MSVPPPALYAWVQQGVGDTAAARAIVAAGSPCPTIRIDNASQQMTQRTASPANFTTISVCEFPLSTANPPSQLSVGGLTLPPPTAESDQIMVVGDTGCRRKGNDQQPCHGDPSQGAWGFPTVSRAAAATAPDPDLILHVGDYLYRESGCDKCGYNWPAWEADFFKPAEEGGLLREAPWIFVRGNHEDCNRAWHGFFLFLADGPWSAPTWPDSACPTSVDPYAVALNGLDVYLVDTSSEDPNLAQTSFSSVDSMLAGAATDAWLTTHVPVCTDTPCDGSMAQAFAASGLAGAGALKWLHMGHIHLFEHFDAQTGPNAHPPQTITGGSGTELDQSSHCAMSAQVYCDANDYTYLVVDAKSNHWDAMLFNLYGQQLKAFSVPR